MSLTSDQIREFAALGGDSIGLVLWAEAMECRVTERRVANLIEELRALNCPSEAIAIAVMALATYVGSANAAREAEAERTARYRERRGIPESEWIAIRFEIIERDGYACQYCKAECASPHIDHIVPLSRGGSNDHANLCVACPQCNASKRDSLVSEWAPPAGGWM